MKCTEVPPPAAHYVRFRSKERGLRRNSWMTAMAIGRPVDKPEKLYVDVRVASVTQLSWIAVLEEQRASPPDRLGHEVRPAFDAGGCS